MKKAVILVLSIIISFVGCGNVDNFDSHGGFHGDGILFQKLSFEDDEVLEEIKGNLNWKSLPLSRSIEALVYGIKEETEDSVHIRGPYLTDENGASYLPAEPSEN